MVTLLSPKQSKPNTEDEEPENARVAPVNHSQHVLVEPAGELAGLSPALTGVESASATSKKNFWAGIIRPIASLWGLLAGPPMTERDRRRQMLVETRTRDAAAQNWFYRTHF